MFVCLHLGYNSVSVFLSFFVLKLCAPHRTFLLRNFYFQNAKSQFRSYIKLHACPDRNTISKKNTEDYKATCFYFNPFIIYHSHSFLFKWLHCILFSFNNLLFLRLLKNKMFKSIHMILFKYTCVFLLNVIVIIITVIKWQPQ